jgi:IS30 family transposase
VHFLSFFEIIKYNLLLFKIFRESNTRNQLLVTRHAREVRLRLGLRCCDKSDLRKDLSPESTIHNPPNQITVFHSELYEFILIQVGTDFRM